MSAAPFYVRSEVVLNGGGAARTGDITISDGDGQLNGSNLFHSFSVFNVLPGESVTFTGPDSIDNVVNRVTGGTSAITGSKMSIIDGPLTSTIGSANFYFINPNGILIGNNAAIQVDGAFHASTADYVKLQDGGVFYADPAQTSTLTSAPPSAFGFLTANPAPIDVGSPLTGGPPAPKASPGQTISLVGGDIHIGETAFGSGPAYLWAPVGGQVNLASVASTGEAVFAGNSIDVSGFAQLGNISISHGSVVDGKTVYIRAGQLVIDDGVVLPGFFSLNGLDAPPDGGLVDVEVSGDLSISGTQTINAINEFHPGISTFAGITGSPDGPVTIGGNVPDIRVSANNIAISGLGAINSDRLGPGAAANVEVTASDTLEVTNGGTIALNNFYGGPGGQLTVTAPQVVLSGAPNAGFTGIQAQTFISPTFFTAPGTIGPDFTEADGGSVTINATGPGGLIVSNGASILGDSFSLGRGSDITINSSDISLSRDGAPFGSISTQSAIAGDSGSIVINATGQLALRDGFEISGTVGGTGDGGIIDITAQSIDLAGTNSGIFSITVPPSDQALNDFAANFGGATWNDLQSNTGQTDFIGVLSAIADGPGFIRFDDRTPGNGGQISLTAGQLTMSGDSRIDSSTVWDGQGGLVEAHLGTLNLTGGAQIRSRSGGISGDTGELVVGTGDGGAINLAVNGAASFSGHSASNASGISTSALGAGNGGNITVTAGSVGLDDGATFSASSTGTGLAGDIVVNAGDEFNLNRGRVTTQATVSDGGNIQITAADQVYLLDSEITTSVESGFGGGGNINIDPEFMILNNSNILANAFGGPGGNINLVANNFIISANSRIDASSALGVDGTVNLSSPDKDVAKDLAVLPANYQDVTGIISDRCTAATAGASSLIAAGPGGLVVDPDGYLPSFAVATVREDEGKGRSRSVSGGKRWWAQESTKSVLLLAQVNCTQ